jgi:hypothetical protein
MIQVAVPTRDNLGTYCDERRQVEKLIGDLKRLSHDWLEGLRDH